MLKEVLSSNQKMKLQDHYIGALRCYSRLYNSSKDKKKYKYLYPVRVAGISFRKAKELGFNITSHMWSTCLNTEKRNKGKLK